MKPFEAKWLVPEGWVVLGPWVLNHRPHVGTPTTRAKAEELAAALNAVLVPAPPTPHEE